MPKDSLYDIGLKHRTDKSTYHEYTKFYDTYLQKIRNEKLEVLEIGIAAGSSLLMWEEYFQNSAIYGADVLDKNYLESSRIKIFQVNQEKEEDLEKLPLNLDLIIDDGGHTMFQQQLTFKKLFLRNLKPKGIYILEDLHTSLPHYYDKGYGTNSFNNTLKLLNDLKSRTFSKDNDFFITEQEFYELLNNIDFVDIYYNGPDKDSSCTSIIFKK